jgi:hypothetical protein
MVASPVRERLTELGPWAWLVGWLVVGVGSAIGALGLALEGSPEAHVTMHVYAIGHALALGLSTTAWASGARRLSVHPVVGTAALALLVGLAAVPADLAGPAGRMAARVGFGGWALLGAAVVALGVPLAEWLSRRLARSGPTRAIAIAIAGILAAGNHFILPLRHPALHLLVAFGAAALVAGALADTRRPVPRRFPRGSLAVALAFAVLSVIVMPPPGASDLLARATGSVLYPWRARLAARELAAWQPADPPSGEWFRPRDDAPATAATPGLDRSASPVVLYLSVDALRADALTNASDAAATRGLRELAETGVWFSSARAPSNRTVATLASVFSGRPFSNLRWSEREHPVSGVNVWPHEDPGPRLPHLLTRAGVLTINVASVDYLGEEYGVVAGFVEEHVAPVTGRGVGSDRQPPWASAADVADVISLELSELASTDRPAFVFAHFLDAHHPYDQGDPPAGADARARWLAEVAVVDAQIARIVATIDALGLGERTTVIVTADHGEAFGEHGTDRHGTSLYDEVLRVPLLIRSPMLPPRTVDVPVSLLDLGPTILDLYGEATPGTWFGRSLVSLAQGDVTPLDRPLVFEARPKQALLRGDGLKVIRDLRLGTLEAYDLARDPGEAENLFDGSPDAREVLFGELATFFSVHEHREPGYATPIR